MNQLGSVKISVEIVGDAMEETGLFNPHADPFFLGAAKHSHSVLGNFECGGQVVTATMDQEPYMSGLCVYRRCKGRCPAMRLREK